MEASEASTTRGRKFLGSYVYQLDEKGRVSLPAAFRREAREQSFVLVQAYAPSLALYPEATWQGVEERMLEMVKVQSEARFFVLQVMSNAVEVTPDSQGRILIPAKLQEAAGLSGQALLVGAIDKIEIWNPAQFEEALRGGAGKFDRFAAQVFR
jgi:MraZ protein